MARRRMKGRGERTRIGRGFESFEIYCGVRECVQYISLLVVYYHSMFPY